MKIIQIVIAKKGSDKVPIVKLADGKEFLAKESETILNAALRSGIVLEHSCKAGCCGACRVRVSAGLTTPVIDETVLTAADQKDGWVLSCCRSAISDVRLDKYSQCDVQVYPIKTIPSKIQTIEPLCPSILRVTLRLPPNQKLKYHSGQYIDVIGKNKLRRSYSIANAYTVENQIELHIRQIVGGLMSKYWFEEAQVDDLLWINGPLGTFFFRDIADTDLILLATGTGIAPIKAMLEDMALWPKEHLPRSIDIYWGCRIREDFYWDPTQIGLPLNYLPVLSSADPNWTGMSGYVQKAVLNSGVNFERAMIYACGSLAMIESARNELGAAGLKIQRFFADAFVSSA